MTDIHSGLIADLEGAGPLGALRLAQLRDASEDEKRRANLAWRTGRRACAAFREHGRWSPRAAIVRHFGWWRS